MIVVTGAAGFIGSCMINKLNFENFNNIIAVDLFDSDTKNRNLSGKRITEFVNRNDFSQWLEDNHEDTEFIFHLGARTDTAETNSDLFRELNLDYSKMVWKRCIDYQIPLIYASSAATYGNGSMGYTDDEAEIKTLQPLNEYGISKNEFDKWVVKQDRRPFFWVGLKFFNVYGPNEYHKGRMSSVIYHAFRQIREHGEIKLFRSHHEDFKDGEQKRDFVYVKDVVDIMYWLMHHRKNSGIYNLGTGVARTFLDLAHATFRALEKKPKISFIDTPEDIRDKYQYFTEAQMSKLTGIGYSKTFITLEDGIEDYVRNYLVGNKHL